MYEKLKLTAMVKRLRQVCGQLPDLRTGKNSIYELADVAMSAFGVFFTQSPSFLARQRDMKLLKGRSNAERLLDLTDLPSDNQIRNLLDPVNPEAKEALPQVRQLINEGKYREAAALISAKVMAKPLGQMPYQTVGDLLLSYPEANSENYRRELCAIVEIERTDTMRTIELGRAQRQNIDAERVDGGCDIERRLSGVAMEDDR